MERPPIVPRLKLSRNEEVYSVPSKIVFKRGSSREKKVLLLKCCGGTVKRCIFVLGDAVSASAAATAAGADQNSSAPITVRCEEPDCFPVPSFAPENAVGLRLVPDKAARFAVLLRERKPRGSCVKLKVFVEDQSSALCIPIIVEGDTKSLVETEEGATEANVRPLPSDYDAIRASGTSACED